MPEIKNLFLKNFLNSFNPKKHKDLSELLFKAGFKHFLYLLIIFFVVMMLLYLPKIIDLPNTLESKIDEFNVLDLKANYEVNEVIIWPKDKPVIKLDFVNENVTKGKEFILVTKERVDIKGMQEIAMSDISNVKSGKDGKFKTGEFVLMLPALIVLAFVYYLLKFLIVILVVSLIAILIKKLSKFYITNKQIVNICLFSSFWLFLGMIIKPLGFQSYYINCIIFVLYVFLGVLFTGSFVKKAPAKV